MPRIAVTGATGFVGQRVTSLLAGEGSEVRALVRPESVRPRPPAGIDVVSGDVRDASAVRSLVDSCDVVVHLAGGFSNAGDAVGTVVEGTANVLRAAKEAGVKRLVHMSCLPANASSETPYYAAKWTAEAAVRGSDVPFTVLRPSLVLGKGDGVLQPLATLLRLLPVTPVPGNGSVRYQPIDVDDVARCVQIAASSPDLESLEVSVGGPGYVTFRQLVDLISGSLDLMRPKVRIPLRWLPSAAQLVPPPGRALYAPPRLEQLQQMAVSSPGIVPRMFGFEPISVLSRIPQYLA